MDRERERGMSGPNGLSDLFDALPTGVLLVLDGRISYANGSSRGILAREGEEITGTDFADWFHPEDRVSLRQVLRRRAEGVRSRGAHTYRLDGPGDAPLGVEVETAPAGGANPCQVIVLLRSVEQRRSGEERLRQVQKMEAIGQLAAGIAHDFNNILGAMANYVTLLKAHVLQQGNGGREHLAEIQGLVDRGTDLVRQILSASRMGKGVQEVHELQAVLKPVVRMLRHTLPKRVRIVVEEEELPPFRLDSGQVQQVIMNLCINAGDAMPQGGDIRIQTGRRNVTRFVAENVPGVEPGPFARIAVTDSGVGMSPEVRQRVFEPFFTTKAEGDHSGLGLSICYAIVRGHGGFMDVESGPGKGSTFAVFLPLIEGQPSQAASPNQSIEGGQETLLLVDDERPMLASTESLLRGLGYGTLTVSSGADAVELFSRRSNEIQLVLVDLGMPGLDGRETFRRMKGIHPGVRALLFTGLPESEEAHRALAEGIRGIVRKPFKLEELSRRIREVLDASDPP
jgi:two-component system, cell cycle sensor histidine kinase and response regulator CckA